MTSVQNSKWPGREITDPVLRAAAQSAVRQGWRYTEHTLHPPGDGQPVELPLTVQWRAQKRALHALYRQGLETVRPTYDAAPAATDTSIDPELLGDPVGDLMARLARGTEVKDDARGDQGFTLAQARQMLRDGYSVDHVVKRTGWGRMWLADLADRLDNG